MNLVVLCNPKSGRGKGARLAQQFAESLRADGHHVHVVSIPKSAEESQLPGALAEGRRREGRPADALIIFGGDGTLHHSLPAAIDASVPIYHVPLGTENLFARQYGMDRSLERLRSALARGSVVLTDVGLCNGRPFVIMCSVGPDANVIHRLAKVRSGAITHLSYVRPGLAELRSPGFVPLTITIDGEEVASKRKGIVVVSNSRQYAMRLDPAHRASMTDGLLDVVFYPCRTRFRALGWLFTTMMRQQTRRRDVVYRHAREVTINNCGSPAPYQLDGEAAGPEIGIAALRISIAPGALKVLVPA
ncbi:MAG: hypothetical protein H7Y88_04355 [Phycisphaerales bacterium]|nr:hypothetical protein [Phycisphaerales bacterium]